MWKNCSGELLYGGERIVGHVRAHTNVMLQQLIESRLTCRQCHLQHKMATYFPLVAVFWNYTHVTPHER